MTLPSLRAQPHATLVTKLSDPIAQGRPAGWVRGEAGFAVHNAAHAPPSRDVTSVAPALHPYRYTPPWRERRVQRLTALCIDKTEHVHKHPTCVALCRLPGAIRSPPLPSRFCPDPARRPRYPCADRKVSTPTQPVLSRPGTTPALSMRGPKSLHPYPAGFVRTRHAAQVSSRPRRRKLPPSEPDSSARARPGQRGSVR